MQLPGIVHRASGTGSITASQHHERECEFAFTWTRGNHLTPRGLTRFYMASPGHIPVARGHSAQLPGIVHRASGTGSITASQHHERDCVFAFHANSLKPPDPDSESEDDTFRKYLWNPCKYKHNEGILCHGTSSPRHRTSSPRHRTSSPRHGRTARFSNSENDSESENDTFRKYL